MPYSLEQIAADLGTELLPDNGSHQNRMEIRSETSSRVYIVAQNNRHGVDHGRWECSCMGWIRHRNCKHLKAMVPSLKLLEAPKAAPKAKKPRKKAVKRLPAKSVVTLSHWERLMGEGDFD